MTCPVCTCECCGVSFSKPKNVSLSAWATRKYCGIQCRAIGARRRYYDRQTPEYYVWQAIIQRCTNPRNPNYRKYGARGITVCDSWRSSFDAFLADMGRRPSPDHSIDRRDNDRGYEPDNCRWATAVEQANNTRWNRYIQVGDTVDTIAGWARRTGIKNNTIVTRLRAGWPSERAVSEPTNTHCRTKRAHP